MRPRNSSGFGRSRGVFLLATVTALITASCGGDESAIQVITSDPAGTRATTAAGTETATTTAGAGSAGDTDLPFTSGPFEGGAEEVMVLSDIRFGDQGGYERVVVEFGSQAASSAEGVPAYQATRGAAPYYDAEGNLVPLYGPYYIEVRAAASRADLSTDPPREEYTGPEYIEPGMDLFYSIEFVPSYEDNTIILLMDMGDSYPFRVTELSDPSRIVIDIEG